MKKTNQKCVRLTDETLNYINSFPGGGFNQKLENMVEFTFKHEKKIKKNIAALEKKQEDIINTIAELCKVERKMKDISRCIEQAHSLVAY